MTEFLDGLHILIVEDDYLMALGMSEMIEEFGGSVVGPVGGLARALALAESKHIAGAILDVNLGEENSYPLADKLLADNVPVIFATCSDTRIVPERFSGVRVLSKPFDAAALEKACRDVFGRVRRKIPAGGPAKLVSR